jgi:hypothetical protein
MEYIEIKNWKKYQADANGQLREGSSPWIKDWVNKEADYEYSKLTYYQRYLYDALRRLRGRFGKNPPNDSGWIARATLTLPRDHSHIAEAIRTLTELRLVRIVDTPFSDVPPKGNTTESITSPARKDKSREEKEKEVEVEPTATTASQKFPIDTEKDQPLDELPKGNERKILTRFAELSGMKFDLLANNEDARKCAVLLVGQHKVEQILAVMESVMTEGWWADKITTFPFFYEHFDEKLLPQYTALARAKKAKAKHEVKSAPGAHGTKSGMKL